MKLLTLTISVALATGITMAQDGPMGHRERRNRTPDAVISALSLTPEQVIALQENRRAKREAIRPVHEAIGELGKQLRTEMSQDNPNPSIAGQFLVDMKSKRDEIKTAAGQFQAQAVEILDDNQKAALAALEQIRGTLPALHQAGSLGLTNPGHGDRSVGERGPHAMFGRAAMGGSPGGGRRGSFRGHRGPRPTPDDPPVE